MDITSYLLIGTYTKGTSDGIYVYRFDNRTGNAEIVGKAEIENPSYFTGNSSGNRIYTVSENERGPSYANALSFDTDTGKLSLLNRQPTDGGAPCHICYDERSRTVVTANYAGGNLNVFPVDTEGRLGELSQKVSFEGRGPDKQRQEAPHIHCVKISPDGKQLFASDLGTDRIYSFGIDRTPGGKFLDESTRTDYPVRPGAGPRHFVFDQPDRHLYLITELSGEVMVFALSGNGMIHIQSVIADRHHAKNAGDIVLSPDGRFLYASVREKEDGIAIFEVSHADGSLKYGGYVNTARHPRSIAVSPDGRFLVVNNMKGNLVQIFSIDRGSGIPDGIVHEMALDRPVFAMFI